MTPEEREELARAAAAANATEQNWTWDGLKRTWIDDTAIDPEETPHWHVWVPQGAFLGGTLITLGDDYEHSGEHCEYVSLACRFVPALLAENEALRKALEQIAAGGCRVYMTKGLPCIQFPEDRPCPSCLAGAVLAKSEG
jgi:hypothetical protein